MRTNEAANHGNRFPEIYTIRTEDQLVSFFHSFLTFGCEHLYWGMQCAMGNPRGIYGIFRFSGYKIPNTVHKLNICDMIDRPIRPWTSTHEKKNRPPIANRHQTDDDNELTDDRYTFLNQLKSICYRYLIIIICLFFVSLESYNLSCIHTLFIGDIRFDSILILILIYLELVWIVLPRMGFQNLLQNHFRIKQQQKKITNR